MTPLNCLEAQRTDDFSVDKVLVFWGKKSPLISASKNDFGAKLDTLAVPGEDSTCSDTSNKDIKSNSDSLSSQTMSDPRTGSTSNVPTRTLHRVLKVTSKATQSVG